MLLATAKRAQATRESSPSPPHRVVLFSSSRHPFPLFCRRPANARKARRLHASAPVPAWGRRSSPAPWEVCFCVRQRNVPRLRPRDVGGHVGRGGGGCPKEGLPDQGTRSMLLLKLRLFGRWMASHARRKEVIAAALWSGPAQSPPPSRYAPPEAWYISILHAASLLERLEVGRESSTQSRSRRDMPPPGRVNPPAIPCWFCGPYSPRRRGVRRLANRGRAFGDGSEERPRVRTHQGAQKELCLDVSSDVAKAKLKLP